MASDTKEDLQQEIARLNEEKARVIREINIPILEAKMKVGNIENEAKETAKSIVEAARKIRAEADAYATKTRYDVTDLLHIAKKGMQEADDMTAKAEQARLEFESYRLATENNIQQNKVAANNVMSEAIALKKETDDLNTNMAARSATLDRKEADLVARELSCNTLKESVTKQNTELQERLGNFNKQDAELKIALAENQKILDDINTKTEYVKREKEAIRKLAADVNKQKIINEEQTIIIKAKFDQIDITQKELDEKIKAFADKEELLAIKSKDVEDRIQVLTELRGRPKKE